jgi:hypothetical protein
MKKFSIIILTLSVVSLLESSVPIGKTDDIPARKYQVYTPDDLYTLKSETHL